MSPSSVLADRPQPTLPQTTAAVSYDPFVPLLIGRTPALLNGFLETLTRAPQTRITRTEVRGFRDPEEDTTQIVVRQWVSLSPSETAERLAAIGRMVEAWMEPLPDEDKKLFVEQIAFQLRRDSHARAV